jgi:hypothetical protein
MNAHSQIIEPMYNLGYAMDGSFGKRQAVRPAQITLPECSGQFERLFVISKVSTATFLVASPPFKAPIESDYCIS